MSGAQTSILSEHPMCRGPRPYVCPPCRHRGTLRQGPRNLGRLACPSPPTGTQGPVLQALLRVKTSWSRRRREAAHLPASSLWH